MAEKPLKILAYTRRKDETVFFDKFSRQYEVDVVQSEEVPTEETSALAEGYGAISIITTPMSASVLKALYERGVRFISTRSIGYDHIDVKAAKALGIRIGNVSYAPDAVSNYTLMFILMAIRNIKNIARLALAQDYAIQSDFVQGRILQNLTVGVAGTGRIGRRVIEHLSGFGCPILAYDKYESEDVRRLARYVSWEDMCASCDIITLHMPAARDNHHIVNAASLAKMKDGVIIINTARGSLIDTAAFMDAVESGKIGSAALDVVEEEGYLYYNNLRGKVLPNRDIAILKSYPNVILTPHTAFYTDQSISDMVENSIKSCIAFQRGEENPWEVGE
ncbi:MAG: D-lactate dehydrogenase VanH-A [Spirochaetales bacterium]|jgi:D-lactate dehydrogenase|nr:D-lactate dehydrogenase VanH-A [Spirochaetales bacterium]